MRYICHRGTDKGIFQKGCHLVQGIFFQLITFIENHPFQFGKIEIAGLSEFHLYFLWKTHYNMTILVYRTVYPPYFYTPLECHFVEVAVSHQIVVHLSKQSLSWDYNESLRSSDFMVFFFLLHEFLTDTGDILKSIENRNEIGESFTSSIVSIYDNTQIFEVVLECDGKGLSLNKSWFFEVTIVKQGNNLLLERVVCEFSFFRLGSQIMFSSIFLHLRGYYGLLINYRECYHIKI